MELTILMPCLNEAQTLATCINKAKKFLARTGTDGEVLIADNGSTDGSQNIAKNLGARVIKVATKGYGAALIAGIKAAQGKYVIMGDADDSYDFLNLDTYLEKLRAGCELVIGNRFKGGIMPGAMPPLHKYLGNPVLSTIGRIFFKSPIKDFHCGLRGFNKAAIEKLNLQTTGMEFASEMVVKASLNKLNIIEVPTVLSKDGRNRPPHLRSWRDGWRHLRFLLMFSPRWLFFYPGIILTLLGFIGMFALMLGPVELADIQFSIHTSLYFGTFSLIGVQAIFFALFAKVYAINLGIIPADHRIEKSINLFSLEFGLMIGLLLTLLGIIGSIYIFLDWKNDAFGILDPTITMRFLIPSAIMLAIGIQTMFSSFFLNILRIRAN